MESEHHEGTMSLLREGVGGFTPQTQRLGVHEIKQAPSRMAGTTALPGVAARDNHFFARGYAV